MKAKSSPPMKQSGHKLQPYQEIPFSPFKQLKPILQRIQSDTKSVSRNQKVRLFASKAIEGYFASRHDKYRYKENVHINTFKIKTKKKYSNTAGSLQSFFQQKSDARQQALRKLHEEYLIQVRLELQRRKDQSQSENQWTREQKILNQYNIVYEYKIGSLPADLI